MTTLGHREILFKAWVTFWKKFFFVFVYLHVRVDHLLELGRRHLGHRVDQIEQLSTNSVVRRVDALQNFVDVLQTNEEEN